MVVKCHLQICTINGGQQHQDSVTKVDRIDFKPALLQYYWKFDLNLWGYRDLEMEGYIERRG